MTKREITEWLESQRKQAIHKCREDCEKQEQAYLDAYFEKSGLRKVAGQIQEHLEQAVRLWSDWRQTQETGEHLSFPETNYLRLERQLDGFVFKEGATYEQFIIREVSLQTGQQHLKFQHKGFGKKGNIFGFKRDDSTFLITFYPYLEVDFGYCFFPQFHFRINIFKCCRPGLQTEELDKLAASRQEMEANVSRNYSRLIRVVSGMKSAADAAEYLQKLGFDLSDLDGEKAMSEIDTTYLFPQQPAA